MKQSDIDSMIEDWVENGLPEELQQLIPTESQCVTCGCTWDKPCYAYHVGGLMILKQFAATVITKFFITHLMTN
ncbi:hypothetical protein QE521_02235 [Streptococcus suis]|uniref:hypothetical protein n=1 Tax=Streptococcus suis TaxID=1307 RepID=UPI0037567F0B